MAENKQVQNPPKGDAGKSQQQQQAQQTQQAQQQTQTQSNPNPESNPSASPAPATKGKGTHYFKNRCFKCERDYREVPITLVPFIYGSTRNSIAVCVRCLLGPEIIKHPMFTAIRDRMNAPRMSDVVAAKQKAASQASQVQSDKPVSFDKIPIGMWPLTRVSEKVGVNLDAVRGLVKKLDIKVFTFEGQECIPRKFVEKIKTEIESLIASKTK